VWLVVTHSGWIRCAQYTRKDAVDFREIEGLPDDRVLGPYVLAAKPAKGRKVGRG
jgi:hypothetical protein